MVEREKVSELSQKMWMEIVASGIKKPDVEHIFHPTRKWRFDFAWIEEKVALEVHGGVFKRTSSKQSKETKWLSERFGIQVQGTKKEYQGGRHNQGKGFIQDREKMNEAQLLGWIVIEVTNEHIKNRKAIEWVQKALQERQNNE